VLNEAQRALAFGRGVGVKNSHRGANDGFGFALAIHAGRNSLPTLFDGALELLVLILADYHRTC
jgi:hypothetical protein